MLRHLTNASFWLMVTVLSAMPVSPIAANEILQFSRPQYETRYRNLIDDLRCLVCQNQNLAESNADLAQDLRHKTHELIEAGKSDDNIIRFMVDRYGDFILYRPPLKAKTILLWTAPGILLAVSLIFFIRVTKSRKKLEQTLPAAKKNREREILDGTDEIK